MADSGRVDVVYNFRVADYHTYFVGGREWGWAAWAHNTCTPLQQLSQSKKSGRASLANALDTPAGSQAHHIVPMQVFQQTAAKASHPLALEAAKRGFKFNGVDNGINLSATAPNIIHKGSHPRFNTAVQQKMDSIWASKKSTDEKVAEFVDYTKTLKSGLAKTNHKLR